MTGHADFFTVISSCFEKTNFGPEMFFFVVVYFHVGVIYSCEDGE